MPTIRPTFGELPRAAALELLRRNHVGRIAFTFHDRVNVEPIHYVYADDYVWARTSPGTKVTTLQHNPWVAFEVDEIESTVDWRSVVVHGVVHFPKPEGTDRDRETYEAGLRHLRSFYADTLAADDIAPERDVIFRIHTGEITGRFATTAARSE